MTVSVIFYFTEEFEKVTPDITGHVENVVANANIAFLKSEIPVKLSIKCMLKTNLREAPDSTDRILEFRDSRGEIEINMIDCVSKDISVQCLSVLIFTNCGANL